MKQKYELKTGLRHRPAHVGQNVQAAASDARAESDHKTLLAIHTLTAQVHEIAEQQTKVLEILEKRSDQGAAIGE